MGQCVVNHGFGCYYVFIIVMQHCLGSLSLFLVADKGQFRLKISCILFLSSKVHYSLVMFFVCLFYFSYLLRLICPNADLCNIPHSLNAGLSYDGVA